MKNKKQNRKDEKLLKQKLSKIKKMNYKIIAKYIKILNFDIFKPDKFLSLSKGYF